MSLALNYSQLVTNLQAFLEDASPDFVANVDTIIGLGELKLIRELNLSIFDKEVTVTAAASSNLLNKPANYLQSVFLTYINGAGQRVLLQPRSRDWILDYNGNGDPLYVADLSSTQWVLAPQPTANRTVTVRFISRPAQLSASNTTTWLSTNVADLLQYACLVAGEEFLKADDRLEVWKAKYTELFATAQLELRKMVRAEYP